MGIQTDINHDSHEEVYDKKLELKRITIFCMLAFLPIFIIMPVLNMNYSVMLFANEKTIAVANAVAALAMFAPATANLLTRLITKEGFENSYLGLNTKGNIKYYLTAVFVKLIEVVIYVPLIWIVFFGDLGFLELFNTDNISLRLATFVSQVGISIIIFVPGFGEEFGWRGYLMPKLTKLMGRTKAIVLGGIIWGLWHAPLTISGHNFGVDYTGYPFTGILLMCFLCITINPLLTLLTEKTDSIYPASICHMLNNNISFGVIFSIFCKESIVEQLYKHNPIHVFMIYIIPLIITGLISLIILHKTRYDS